jgi:hypothetical protein
MRFILQFANMELPDDEERKKMPKDAPPARILPPNLKDSPTTPCTDCGVAVRGAFQPIYCYIHRNNQEPVSGWAFCHRDEIKLLNLLRNYGWTYDAYVFCKQREHEYMMRMINQGAAVLAIDSEHEESKDHEQDEETKEHEPYRERDSFDSGSGDSIDSRVSEDVSAHLNGEEWAEL